MAFSTASHQIPPTPTPRETHRGSSLRGSTHRGSTHGGRRVHYQLAEGSEPSENTHVIKENFCGYLSSCLKKQQIPGRMENYWF